MNSKFGAINCKKYWFFVDYRRNGCLISSLLADNWDLDEFFERLYTPDDIFI
jgi:hypothetical protein